MPGIRKDTEIYTVVSNYYKNKGLDKEEFSNRLKVIKDIVLKDYSVRDCIEFLEMREHWSEFDKEEKTKMKSRTRNQIKSILKKLDLTLEKDGLKDLRGEKTLI